MVVDGRTEVLDEACEEVVTEDEETTEDDDGAVDATVVVVVCATLELVALELETLELETRELDELDELEGRGHRRRAVVNYTDGLSDDQWAMVSLTPCSFVVTFIDRTTYRPWRRVRISRNSPNEHGRGRRVVLRLSSCATSTLAALRWRTRRAGGKAGKAREGPMATRRLRVESGNVV